jgi:rhamnosyl/mannosyltransferase
MRILEVYKDVHPYRSGGIERYIHDLSVHLVARGHRVAVLTAGAGLRERTSTVSGFSVVELPCFGRLLSTPVSFSYRRAMREWRPDVVHFHLPMPTAEVARLLETQGPPYVATYHSDIVRQAFLLPLYGPLLRKFLAGASMVLATSERYAATSPFLAGLANVRVVPIGVNQAQFSPGDGKRNGYFLFAGRFRSYKGIPVLLSAWRLLTDPPPLVLAGGGPLEQWIRRASRGLPLRIDTNPGDEALVDLYRGAEALILPSVKRSEAYGMVQLEAMACGTPVISTDLPTGVPWVNIHGESGLVVPPGDPAALADAVRRILNDPALRDRLAAGALQRARTVFHSGRLFGEVEECLTEAASGSPAS